MTTAPDEGPLVSVVMPCYNCAPFVEQAVRSLFTQTYTNFELLITDDCSTDDTFRILERLSREDSRVRLLQNSVNQGIVCSLNTMIEQSRGEFIARMDGDDVCHPERIASQLDFLLGHSDFGLCGCEAWHIDHRGRKVGKSTLPHTNDDIQIFKLSQSPFYHPCVMIRSSHLKANLYRKEFQWAEDYDLWLRLLAVTKGNNLRQRLFYYRLLPTSVSRRQETAHLQANRMARLQDTKKSALEFHKIGSFRVRASVVGNLVRGQVIRPGSSFEVAFLFACDLLFRVLSRLRFLWLPGRVSC